MSMPKQKPGRSKQTYGTPRDFLDAVERRFGPITFDLACDETNRVVPNGFTEQDNALLQVWPDRGVNWLNPPFAQLAPWAQKVGATKTNPAWTLMLVPASIGAEWFRWIKRDVFVLGLNPRLTFVGEKNPYPKDLMLVCAGFGVVGFDVWRWK